MTLSLKLRIMRSSEEVEQWLCIKGDLSSPLWRSF